MTGRRRISVSILGAVLLGALPLATSARDYTRTECPIVGNKSSRLFHVPGGASYEKMLQDGSGWRDNRICFRTEKEARENGYKRAKQ
jgi:hypothetical protein